MDSIGLVNSQLSNLLKMEEEYISDLCTKFSSMKNMDSYIQSNSDSNYVKPVD